MRIRLFYFIGLFFVLIGCKNISRKPVFEKLMSNELSEAIKDDTSFSGFYTMLREEVDQMDDITRAKFNEVTYRRLFKYYKFRMDTSYWNAKSEKWSEVWEREFSKYSTAADSTLNYWKKYKDENSLEKYVKVELVNIRKEYYEYIGGLKDVYLVFRMTPLQGIVQQFRFNYGYMPKIHGDSKYYEKHNCIELEPLSSPRIGYWEVSYSDKDKFAGKTVESFLRDYNFFVEVTEIRKDGINISSDDFDIPKEVTECLDVEGDYPALFDWYKDILIKKLIKNDYLTKWEYLRQKREEVEEKKDKLCFDFFKELYKQPE